MFRKRSTDGSQVPSLVDCFRCRSIAAQTVRLHSDLDGTTQVIKNSLRTFCNPYFLRTDSRSTTGPKGLSRYLVLLTDARQKFSWPECYTVVCTTVQQTTISSHQRYVLHYSYQSYPQPIYSSASRKRLNTL